MDRPRLAPTLVLVVLVALLAVISLGTFSGMRSPATVCTEMQAEEAQAAFLDVGTLVDGYGEISLLPFGVECTFRFEKPSGSAFVVTQTPPWYLTFVFYGALLGAAGLLVHLAAATLSAERGAWRWNRLGESDAPDSQD